MPQSTVTTIISGIEFNQPSIVQIRDEQFEEKEVQVSILRLDEVHPFVSGNKLFKLIYFLKEAKESQHKTIITFGGAYSNHLAATAFACERLNIKSIGIVRGEQPKLLSHTLQFCREHGMQLKFVSRSQWKNLDERFIEELKFEFGQHILIPEGGFSIKGKQGASLINEYFQNKNVTHVCLAVGTATTFAGIVEANNKNIEIIGFGVLKNTKDVPERFTELQVNPSKKYSFIGDYHFGGYAKKSSELISFMNRFYEKYSIPLDFVYTGKMMAGVYDLISKNYFPRGSKIVCIHTGGLQGNNSLTNELIY
jgi:1-aminocyclopropane-1-carboxylate deaminase/D-cysteine desulfhydrase-like pyridoxal-dependent ACC family enzyme